MTFSRLARLLVFLLLLPSVAAAQQPASCDSDAHRQFDFWIGEWTVTDPGGTVQGENSIERTLDGCVLHESWKGTSGSVGESFNIYDRTDGRWHQTWVDNGGNRLEIAGGLDEQGRMVMSGEGRAADGSPIRHEITWTPREDGSVLQHWRSTRDGGESWQIQFEGIYRPMG